MQDLHVVYFLYVFIFTVVYKTSMKHNGTHLNFSELNSSNFNINKFTFMQKDVHDILNLFAFRLFVNVFGFKKKL